MPRSNSSPSITAKHLAQAVVSVRLADSYISTTDTMSIVRGEFLHNLDEYLMDTEWWYGGRD